MVAKLTTKEFIKKFNQTKTSEYFDIIWDYVWSKKPIKVKCKTCWKEYFYQQAQQLIVYTRYGCPDCWSKNRDNHEASIDSINNMLDWTWFVCTVYNTAKKKSEFVCLWCGRKFYRYWNNVKNYRPHYLKSKYCVFCQKKSSYWEKIIAMILDKLNIEYCYNQALPIETSLHYDFIIEDKKIIIEVDWWFHFDNRTESFSNRSIEKQKEYDTIKDRNAEQSWYKIIRLHYDKDKLWDFFAEIIKKLWWYLNLNNLNLSLIDLLCLPH